MYGRPYLLINCDNFTKSVFREMNIEQTEMPIINEKESKVVHPIPKLGDGYLPIGSGK